jgi:putative two-component system hydrogenase maturation factor HypX/HoxX
MKILLLTHSFNSLSQRLYIELKQHGHQVSVEFDINDAVTVQAVDMFRPELIIAPFLKRAIPEQVWRSHCCLVVHPGIRGDRGPSALDWAILDGEQEWGVTVLQANAEMDAGDIWASVGFPMREATKASLYRNEVTEAAVTGVLLAVERFQQEDFKPEPLDYDNPEVMGRLRPLVTRAERAVDWQHDDTARVLRKIRSADGFPGVTGELCGQEFSLYDARPAEGLSGNPGEVIGRCDNALCVATADGAVWIGHLRDREGEHPFKLPAIRVLEERLEGVAEIENGYRDIWYEERGEVGYLHFPFYNGAMSTEQCKRLREAYVQARQRNTRVIVLMGGPDFWSNGIHLNIIEAAESPADESWENINAINDLALEIITTDSHITVAALQGNAGAGGVFLARAADYVWARSGVVLNPHYKDMGNLYGSEYWTYLLPKRVGEERAHRITQARLPMGTAEAKSLGLVDDFFAVDHVTFTEELDRRAQTLAQDKDLDRMLREKAERRRTDEEEKPLAEYRREELERMNLNFYGFDPSYHVARYNFVYKVPKSRTPITIAHHRDKRRDPEAPWRSAS